jgi:hypothetical protein
MSTFPDRYREVSVTDVDVPLELEPLRILLTSRPVYRRSRYLVVRRGAETALVEVIRGATAGLFSAVEDVVLLATPAQTVYLHRPELDTGVPSDLVKAAQDAPDARCVVVEGSYGHVSFVLDPDPVRLHVLDVAPPWPAKLLDQVQRLLQTSDDLTGVLPVPHVVELPDLLPGEPTGHYLLPCRGGGMDVPGAEVSYLDEVPPQADWTLLGCARSRAIHDFFYDGPVPQVDTCPRTIAAGVQLPPGEVLLTKCCLLENHVEVDGQVVVAPWGASFGHLREALQAAVELAEKS